MTTTIDYDTLPLVKLNYDAAYNVDLGTWQRIDKQTTAFLGTYHATVATHMRALVATIALEDVKWTVDHCNTAVALVASHVENTMSVAGEYICGQPMWVKDREVWHPKLIQATQLFVAEVVESVGMPAFGGWTS